MKNLCSRFWFSTWSEANRDMPQGREALDGGYIVVVEDFTEQLHKVSAITVV